MRHCGSYYVCNTGRVINREEILYIYEILYKKIISYLKGDVFKKLQDD